MEKHTGREVWCSCRLPTARRPGLYIMRTTALLADLGRAGVSGCRRSAGRATAHRCWGTRLIQMSLSLFRQETWPQVQVGGTPDRACTPMANGDMRAVQHSRSAPVKIIARNEPKPSAVI